MEILLKKIDTYFRKDFRITQNPISEKEVLNSKLQPILDKYNIVPDRYFKDSDFGKNNLKNKKDLTFLDAITPAFTSFFNMLDDISQSKEFNLEILKILAENYDLCCIVYKGAPPELYYDLYPFFEQLFIDYYFKCKEAFAQYRESMEKKRSIISVISSITFFRDDGLRIARLFENIPAKYAFNAKKPFFLDKLEKTSADEVKMYINDFVKKLELL